MNETVTVLAGESRDGAAAAVGAGEGFGRRVPARSRLRYRAQREAIPSLRGAPLTRGQEEGPRTAPCRPLYPTLPTLWTVVDVSCHYSSWCIGEFITVLQ